MTKDIKTIFNEYLRECKYSNRLRTETLRGYTHTFNTLLSIVPEIAKPEHLTKEIIITFFERAQTRVRVLPNGTEKQGIKDSTVKTYWSKLFAFFKWMEIKSYIKVNPLKDMKKPSNPEYTDARAIKEDDVKRIVASVSLNNTDSLLMKRDLAILYTLLYTGMRKGELLGLEVTDIVIDLDREREYVTIRGVTSKSKKTRILPMNPVLVMHIKEYLRERKSKGYKTASLWVSSNEDKGLTAHGIKHWVKKYNALSGVKFHLHRFRHTFACTLAEKNVHMVKIQKLMGHTDMRMTQSYLRSITVEDCRVEVDSLSF
jgi:site-specific recombinase XerD